MREKEGSKGYDPSVHSWRFKEQVPLPEGKWPPLWNFYKNSVLDEHAKEELAQRKREENEYNGELIRRYRRLQKEVEQRREQFPPGEAPSDKELRKEVAREERLAKANERHAKNVQMAVRLINRRYPDRKYELKEITAKSSIYELGSAYCHYNFTVYSPTDGSEFYFAEMDIDPVYEFHVYQCCRLGSGPHGMCMLIIIAFFHCLLN